mgnify:FL=1
MKQLSLSLAVTLSVAIIPATDSHAQQVARMGDVISIGCNVPSSGTRGSETYSVDARRANGDWIETTLGATPDKAVQFISSHTCNQTLNSILSSSKGCSSSYEGWSFAAPAINVIVPQSSYSLILYTLECLPVSGCVSAHGSARSCG